MTDEELRGLGRAAIAGEEDALERLRAYARRELQPVNPPPVNVAYRAKDREEFWRLTRSRMPRDEGAREAVLSRMDADGLAPMEDRRRALEVVDARLVQVWRRGDFAFAEIQVPIFPRAGVEPAFVEAIRSGMPWPEPMEPGEYREWSG